MVKLSKPSALKRDWDAVIQVRYGFEKFISTTVNLIIIDYMK
jgi:hypothetical protein